MNNQIKLPNWFEAKIYESGRLVFSSETQKYVELDAISSSMYDLVIGCEFVGKSKKEMLGKKWLKTNYPLKYIELFNF
jgi:hypothetical protein